MTSKRFVGIGDNIMKNSQKRNSSISSLLDNSMRSMKSIKSIRTNSTLETQKRENIKEILNLNPLNFNSISSCRRLPTESNIFTSKNNSKRTHKCSLRKYITTKPNKKPEVIIEDADKILKDRQKHFILPNQLVKNVFLKNTKEICLDNYKIKLMSKKRNDLNTRVFVISKALKSNLKLFNEDYRHFFEFVEINNNSYKRQEELLNMYKKIIDHNEIEYNKQVLENKKIKEDIENMVRKILTLRYYGRFIHNVYKIDFIYEGIKREEGQSHLGIAEDIIETYEKNKDKNDDINSLDEYWLMAQIKEFELNIISIVKEREMIKKDLQKMGIQNEEEISLLKEQIKDYEERIEVVKDEKKRFMKTIITYNTPEIMDNILDCIDELNELLKSKNNPTYIILKEKTPMNYISLCSNLIKKVKEKEKVVNNYIEEIENIINGENKEDKLLIEEIIAERRREVKKRKLFELLKQQQYEEMKKNMKAVEKLNRIVIKGRKGNTCVYQRRIQMGNVYVCICLISQRKKREE